MNNQESRMKSSRSRILFVAGVSLLTLISLPILGTGQARGETIEIRVDFPTPVVTKVGEYHRVTMEDMPGILHPGEPVLPAKGINVLIPFGQEVTKVKVLKGEEVTLEGSYIVEPGQKPVPLSFTGEIIPTLPDEKIYGSREPFPAEVETVMSRQMKRGYEILPIVLHPVEYIPKEGELSYYKSMTVVVKTSPVEEPAPHPLYRGLPKDKEKVLKIIDNPETIESYPAKKVR